MSKPKPKNPKAITIDATIESAKRLAEKAKAYEGKTYEELLKEIPVTNGEERRLLQEIELINNMKYAKSRRKRIEAIRKQLKRITVICGAIEQTTGKVCTKKPHTREDGSSNGRCIAHGGDSNGPATAEGKARALANLHPQAKIVTGLYTHFSMTQEELDFYVHMMNHYINAYELDPINTLLLDRGVRNFILNQRKERAEAHEILEEDKAYNDYDSKFLRYMQALGLDRKFNLSKEHKDNGPSMTDLAVLLSGANTHEVEAEELSSGDDN